jgi:hypothetical protein
MPDPWVRIEEFGLANLGSQGFCGRQVFVHCGRRRWRHQQRPLPVIGVGREHRRIQSGAVLNIRRNVFAWITVEKMPSLISLWVWPSGS